MTKTTTDNSIPGAQLPIPRTTIPTLVSEFNGAIGDFKAGLALMQKAKCRMDAAFLPRYSEFDFFSDKYVSLLRYDNGMDNIIKEVTRHVWETLIERMGIRSVMSVEDVNKMEEQVKSDQMPPITEENLLATMEGIFNRIPEMMEKAVKEVYDWLRPRSYRDDEYKTNEKNIWQLGERVILSWMVEQSYSGRGFRAIYSSDRSQRLTCLDNVFLMLDGKGTIKTAHGPLYDAIHASETGRGETDYFEFKCCQNHNLHIRFKRMDLVAQLNAVAGGMRIKDARAPKHNTPKKQEPMTKTKTVEVPDNVRAILKELMFDGNVVKLPRQLSRELYVEVNKVLTKAGGTWNRAKGGHVFSSDPRELLFAAMDKGEFVDKKQTYQFFETPPDLAARMAGLLEVLPQHTVLEPSAGSGNLVTAVLNAGVPADNIQAIEIQEDLRLNLLSFLKTHNTHIGDFLQLQIAAQFDRIIANPPFSGGQDVAHVTRMLSLLRPGGILVSVMSPSWTFRLDSSSQAFRKLLLASSVPLSVTALSDGGIERILFDNGSFSGSIEKLPAGSFRVSGTDVAAFLLKVRRLE